jgi:hypothetical protein
MIEVINTGPKCFTFRQFKCYNTKGYAIIGMVIPAWIYLYANGDKYEENRTNDLSIFYLT